MTAILRQATYCAIETGLKGLGYKSSVGDAGTGHPDANVVSAIVFIDQCMLISIGRLAWRADSSACTGLHQIKLPSPLPTCLHETRCEAIHLGELVNDCGHYRLDDWIFLYSALSLWN